jgi:hypothetical protein
MFRFFYLLTLCGICFYSSDVFALTSSVSGKSVPEIKRKPVTDVKRKPTPAIKTGVVQEKCLISWDDSIQVHSVKTIIRWNYQAVKTKMKKLRHCIKLTVTGPVDINGLARDYVKSCIDHALNYDRSQYILQAIVALGADIAVSKGGASAANLTAYVDHVKTTSLSCLSNVSNMERYLKNALGRKFDATVQSESHWIYWDL